MVRAETGYWRQGGSTITQQLARTVFLNNSRTFDRKIREAVLAMALEWNFSKDQILELYLNKVYFGGGAYGIDAASRKFFGHEATELSLAEAAIIAGLVKAPSRYSPTADAKAAVNRAEVVLAVMQEAGAITAEQRASANLSEVEQAPEAGQNSARYFTDWALPQLDLILPDNDEPIEVWTTLDPGMQRAATAAVAANAPKGAQGALVSLDRDGAVLAMVGGTDYVTSNYNRATNAVRQPGSAWKLFVYLAALESGYKPDDRVVDEPVTINGWSPHNSGGGYAGEIDVRTAFAYSKNTVAAQLGNEVGFGTVASMARRFGISTPVNTLPSMVLGTSDVRLIDMTRAFAAVSAKGAAVEPYGILKVTKADGEEIYRRPAPRGELLVPAYVAFNAPTRAKTIMTVHNMAFQGLFGWDVFPQLRLDHRAASEGAIEYWGGISYLKAGLQCADRLTTVSPTYAFEISTAAYGMGFEGLLRSRADVLVGILHGIDVDGWDSGVGDALKEL